MQDVSAHVTLPRLSRTISPGGHEPEPGYLNSLARVDVHDSNELAVESELIDLLKHRRSTNGGACQLRYNLIRDFLKNATPKSPIATCWSAFKDMSKRDHTSLPGQSEKVRKTWRGRTEKACVRCRAKKRTCEGGNPCMRCKKSHSVCYVSDWHYVVSYPREYVEYLEEQQEQLSIALLRMRRLFREANVHTVPTLPDTEQAHDLLLPLKLAKLNHHSTHTSQPRGVPHGMRPMAYENEDGAIRPGQYPTVGSIATSPIPPSVFPPLHGTLSSLKPPSHPPCSSSFLLTTHQSESLAMPLHPRISFDPRLSGSSSGGGGNSPAIGSTPMTMSLPGTPWPYPSRSLPTNASAYSPGYQTPVLTPSSATLMSTSGHEAVPNQTWMFGHELGIPAHPGTDCSNNNNGEFFSGDADLRDWNDVV